MSAGFRCHSWTASLRPCAPPTPTPTPPLRPHCSQGIHVVTPNKKLNSGPLAEYLAVKQLQRAGKAHYM
jgi:hypothetical protein